MNTIPLTSVKELFTSHLTVLNYPKNTEAMFYAYMAGVRAWGNEYSSRLLAFGKDPLNAKVKDSIYFSNLLLHSAKAGADGKLLTIACAKFLLEIFTDTGLSVDAFTDLISEGEPPEFKEGMREFLNVEIEHQKEVAG